MFILDARLKATSFLIGEGPLSQIRLKNNRLFPWLILIPRQAGLTEIYELKETDQQLLMQEIAKISECMKAHFKAVKMNCGALGNIVSQLHIHVIARDSNDAAWPHSVWQPGLQEEFYTSQEAEQMVLELKRLLSPLID